ncbi:hypothetical protein B0A50_00396 [Salinomyces thailandicus]|uniref:RNA exonuclease 4 n=1 Tax=Salinomyces thailandicus TaxID=706561 RepID=A0A4U0UDI1_9PEZI|nr:hypothetical protein B0A50_00396 [Salinomyces thailandica]
MSRVDPNQVSSNWKKLQERLKAENKDKPQSNGLKRKRPEEQKKPFSKRTKLSGSNTDQLGKRRKMGNGGSKAEVDGRTRGDHSTLVQEHGIAAADVSAAYGSANATMKHSQDEINSGLHDNRKAGKFVALDCEMVGTGPPPHTDNVLARASLVNFHGEQIYDSYVQAPSGIKVEDYRTHVSGIQSRHMREGYARPFRQVQKDVSQLLDGRILVGHALRNDLQALLLSHPKRDLRDTSRHPKFRVESMGKPPALRNLAKTELGLQIQTGEHSSVEDARAAMLLFRKEKAGFEEENRRHFGQQRRVAEKKPVTKAQGGARGAARDGVDVDENGEEDEEDLELLDGETEGIGSAEEEDGEQKGGAAKAKKKRKKKKRTKRH